MKPQIGDIVLYVGAWASNGKWQHVTAPAIVITYHDSADDDMVIDRLKIFTPYGSDIIERNVGYADEPTYRHWSWRRTLNVANPGDVPPTDLDPGGPGRSTRV